MECVCVCEVGWGGGGGGGGYSLVCSMKIYMAPVGVGRGGRRGNEADERKAPCGTSHIVNKYTN